MTSKLINLPQVSAINTTPLDSSFSLKLQNLDEFNILSILDYVDFSGLINLSSASDRLRNLIATHYMIPKYRIDERQTFIFKGSSDEATTEEISLGKETTIYQFLHNFGEYVTEISFAGEDFDGEQIQKISQHIERYCATNLKSIMLLFTNAHLLRDTDQIFANVVDVYIHQGQAWKNVQIARIYPSVERLTINGAQLKQMREDRVDIKSVPNLHSIEVFDVNSTDLLDYINQSQPNLEALSISIDSDFFHSSNKESVLFKHVRNFTITTFDLSDTVAQSPVQFEQIESLTIGSPVPNGMVMDLLKRSTTLKTLRLTRLHGSDLMFRLIFGILKGFPHFNEITFYWNGVVRAPKLLGYLNEISQLTRITISSAEANQELLISAIPEQWQLERVWEDDHEPYEGYFLTITRTNT